MEKKGRPSSGFLPPDLHIHTAYSRHATGTMEETVLSAVAKGLTEIGFADHFPYPSGFIAPAPDCVIPDETAFASYAAEVRRLQSVYNDRITIRFGVEADYLERFSCEQKAMREKYSFDYIIGSVHIVQGVAVDYREDMLAEHLEALGGADGLWEKYWDALERLVRSGWSHVTGHFDLPKKYRSSAPRKSQAERAEDILRQIKERDMALEVNTGGIDRAYDREPYPSRSHLKLASELGVDVTLGSDAHSPADVGRYFPETLSRLKSLGWNRVITFQAGRKVSLDLS
jgi:histidinol-phosphatase (PHP family)